MGKKILDVIQQELLIKPGYDSQKEVLLQNIERLKQQRLNILLVGATGVGKSSTINAIFDDDVSIVGHSPAPETHLIETHILGNLVLWDTPGLGDSPEHDKVYAKQIATALKSKDETGNLLIDEVLVIVDGSNRDMRTTYEIIDNIILPYIGEPERIIIAINQCDLALKGRDWSDETGPGDKLAAFLEEKVASVQQRLLKSNGIHTKPIYYSALHRYNISKLVALLIQKMPENKRFLIADTLNKNPDIWQKNDDLSNYNEIIRKEVHGSLANALSGAAKGAQAGSVVGSLIPIVGPIIGATIGAALGFLGGLFE